MDGIEVIALIFAKKLGATVGTFCMVYNVLLYIVCGFVHDAFVSACARVPACVVQPEHPA